MTDKEFNKCMRKLDKAKRENDLNTITIHTKSFNIRCDSVSLANVGQGLKFDNILSLYVGSFLISMIASKDITNISYEDSNLDDVYIL